MLGTMALATPSEPPSRLPQIPDHDGGYEPSERGTDHHQPRRQKRHKPPYGDSKPNETNTSDRSTSGVEASGFPATDCSVQAVLLFFLFRVFFN
jgi:hypothetical protein